MITVGIIIGLIILAFQALKRHDTFKEMIEGFTTNKEDLDINWKVLEEAEKNLKK